MLHREREKDVDMPQDESLWSVRYGFIVLCVGGWSNVVV